MPLSWVGVAQWAARLTDNGEVVGSSNIKGPRCFREQDTLPLLLSAGCFVVSGWLLFSLCVFSVDLNTLVC